MVKFTCPYCGYSMQTAQYLNGKGHCLKCDAVVADTEAHPLNPEWTRKMKKKFDALNTDGAVNSKGYGTLDFDEMKSLLLRGNPDMTDDELTSLFEAADSNGNGTIEFTEFLWFLYGSPSKAGARGGGARGGGRASPAPRVVATDHAARVAHPAERRAPGEASTFKLAPSDACESDKGVCPKNDGGPHHFKFGRCEYCGVGEGRSVRGSGVFAYAGGSGGCPKDGGKCMFKFGKCKKCGRGEY
mmetsp:Transcript_14712/g.26021  ORF Transcript_14712/g.26021 Transcript_14712/m.26021 type:complete len:243 (-) Transcript_14712:82-810(-)